MRKTGSDLAHTNTRLFKPPAVWLLWGSLRHLCSTSSPPRDRRPFCFVRFRSCFISHWSLKQRNTEVRGSSFVWAVICERRAFWTACNCYWQPPFTRCPVGGISRCHVWNLPMVKPACCPLQLMFSSGASWGVTGSEHWRFYCLGRAQTRSLQKGQIWEYESLLLSITNKPEFEVREAQRWAALVIRAQLHVWFRCNDQLEKRPCVWKQEVSVAAMASVTSGLRVKYVFVLLLTAIDSPSTSQMRQTVMSGGSDPLPSVFWRRFRSSTTVSRCNK